MLDRASCERRVYRLATLLTGHPRRAAGVIAAVVEAQPDLRALDNAYMDRLTVLRSREITPEPLRTNEVSERVAKALIALPQQQREAWVFARIYRMELRELSRAMDCSTQATQRHLAAADAAMAGRFADGAAQAAQELLRYALSLDVPEVYRAAQRRRRALNQLLVALIVAVVIAAGLAALRFFL